MAFSSKSVFHHFCDFHIDEDAKAACLKHRKMLCFQCISDKSCGKSDGCIIKDINKFTEDDTSFLCIAIRQNLERKERLIEEYDSQTLKIKNDLEKEIIGKYENVIQRVNQMKENTIKSLEKQADEIIDRHKQEKDELLNFKATVLDVIGQIANEDEMNSSEYSQKIKQLMKELEEKHQDKKAIIDGKFEQDTRVKAITDSLNCELGKVYLMEEDHYFKVSESENETPGKNRKKDETLRQAESKHLDNILTTDSRTSSELNEEIKEHKQHYLFSDECNEDTAPPEPPPRLSTYANKNTANNEELQKQKENLEIPTRKKGEKAGFFKGLFSGNPDKSKEKADSKLKPTDTFGDKRTTETVSSKPEEEYADSCFLKESEVSVKSLINTSIRISALSQTGLVYKFSQLIDLENGNIGLFSPIQNIVAIVTLNGSLVYNINLKEHAVQIVEMGHGQFALLAKDGSKIMKYDVTKKPVNECEYLSVEESVPDISGFDFECKSHLFVISSPTQILFIDRKGKTKSKKVYGDQTVSDGSKIYTIYDFTAKLLYSVNASHGKMKCIHTSTRRVVWRKKFDAQMGTPGGVCLYKNKLCIASVGGISQFATEDGNPLMRYDKIDQIEDCLGICVIDEVIVVSSNSDDVGKSVTLAFKSW